MAYEDPVATIDDTLMRVHGFLMVLAWMGCGGTGLLIARYYRRQWQTKVMGFDLWFPIHVIMMMVTMLILLISIVIICVHAGLWPYSFSDISTNPHAVFGVLSCLFTFIQPVLAVLRCKETAEFRWVFNWAHRLIGNMALVFGLTAMVLAGFMTQLAENDNGDGVDIYGYTAAIVCYIAFYYIAHLILTEVDKRASEREDPEYETEEKYQEGKDERVRWIVLVVFTMSNVACIITLAYKLFTFVTPQPTVVSTGRK